MAHGLYLWLVSIFSHVRCFFSDHKYGAWCDEKNGCYWRTCHRCDYIDHRTYIEMLLEERRSARERLERM